VGGRPKGGSSPAASLYTDSFADGCSLLGVSVVNLVGGVIFKGGGGGGWGFGVASFVMAFYLLK